MLINIMLSAPRHVVSIEYKKGMLRKVGSIFSARGGEWRLGGL